MRYAIGQHVKSRIDKQGLVKGETYTVIDVKVQSTPFGQFLTYILADGVNEYAVGNGHLVLEGLDS